ncbi:MULTISPECIES: hypothetical protein [Deinococcus]|uniref:DNA alkylation repair enzyme n=1 Tax=Deinococcus rufus TaxID=2136097 RepID=A0ABV7Z7Z3_9DEIO|nr:hypothetical protein [Deinococcus sp. AB2017081]WQE94425.1 hypothetical protein U2P90_13550 [Deinococcus sp. AB2017081]
MSTAQTLHDTLLRLVEASAKADSAVIEAALPELASMVGGSPADLSAFFKADPEGIRLFLAKGVSPTSFAGKRFAALLPFLAEMLNAIYAHERGQVETFLAAKTAGEDLARTSLFMSPTIKAAILDEWVNKPWKGVALSERIWDFSKASEDSLLKLIATKIAEGKSPKQIQPIIRKVFKDQSTYNVRRLLLTESSRVWHDVQNLAYQEFKHIKHVKLKYGVRHKKDCACTPWHDKGNIPYEDAPTMPIHPFSSSYLQAVVV